MPLDRVYIDPICMCLGPMLSTKGLGNGMGSVYHIRSGFKDFSNIFSASSHTKEIA